MMKLDESAFNHRPDGAMQLPAGVVANAPYQGAAPMLPNIAVPLVSSFFRPRSANGAGGISQQSPGGASKMWQKVEIDSPSTAVPWAIRPSMRNAAVFDFSAAQLHQITGSYGRRDSVNQSGDWTYEMRRDAQQILPHLFLGPTNAARDRVFLRRAGITKVMAVRDSRLAEARLLVVEHVAKELGMESECIDVADARALLRALAPAVQSINRHMLAMPTDAQGVSTGKVLVYCETGNVRSPPVVAAYLMSMYGMELLDALQFVHKARFCISLDEEYKRMLLSFADLLQARRDVAVEDDLECAEPLEVEESVAFSNQRGRMGVDSLQGQMDGLLDVPLAFRQRVVSRSRTRPPKRYVEETMDERDDRAEAGSQHIQSREPSVEPSWLNLDMARYQDRPQFVPFTDNSVEEMAL